jgi:prepilin peptidase CpaA
MVYDATIGQVVLIAAGAVLLAAAAQDFLDYVIPNRLVLALVALYPIYILASGNNVDWLGGLLVGLAMLAAGLLLFGFRLVGGGDAKLLAATALWAGPSLLLPFLLLTAFSGGVLAMMVIATGRLTVFFPVLLRIFPQQTAVLGQQKLAYGVAIAAGGLFVLSRHLAA